MFITGIIIGLVIGSFSTLIIYSCLILAKSSDERIYKNS